MLENYAYRLLMLEDWVIAGLLLAVFIGSFALEFGLRLTSLAPMKRLPYLFWGVVVTSVMSQMVWAGVVHNDALEAGMLWVVVAFQFSLALAMGIASSAISRPRVADMGKSRGWAWASILPLVNLYLVLAPSKDPEETSVPRKIANFVGIILILLLFGVSTAFSNLGEETVKKISDRMANDPDALGAYTAASIRAIGLHDTLAVIASQIEPSQIDEATWVEGVTVFGDELAYRYRVDTDVTQISMTFLNELSTRICQNPFMVPILEAGGKVRHEYVRNSDGASLGSALTSTSDCKR